MVAPIRIGRQTGRAAYSEAADSAFERLAYHRGFQRSRERSASVFQPVGMMRAGYNIHSTIAGKTRMEAEKINQIANTLSDLQQRAADLRRYL
jgi:hypothetical protein